MKVIDESFSRLTAAKRSAAIVEFGCCRDSCHTRIISGKVLHPTRERMQVRPVGFSSYVGAFSKVMSEKWPGIAGFCIAHHEIFSREQSP